MYPSYRTSKSRQFATPDDIRKVFLQYQPELEWFGYFITGDERIAEACVVDAGALSVSQNQVFEDWLLEWARYATIRSAIQAQRERRMLHGPAQERPLCTHKTHEPLTASTLDLVMENTELLIKRLDTLSRVALVVHGIEKHSLGEAAILAGVSPKTLRAAYCAALHCVNVMECEGIRAGSSCTSLFH